MRASILKLLITTILVGAYFGMIRSGESLQPATLPGAPKLGEAAPDFALSNIEGKRVQLKDYRGKKNVALVFYPALFRAGG